MKAIKTLGKIGRYVLAILSVWAVLLFLIVAGEALEDKIREGCTTERSSETMNRVTCKSGTHYETR